jgi:hypothetical protein
MEALMFGSKDGNTLSLRAAIANLVACGALLLPPAADNALAGGFDRNENFVAFLPALGTQEVTDKAVKALLDRANYHRQRIALEWLGEELPPSVGQAIINVDYSAGSDRGLTWAKDHPDRKFHSIYLVVPREDLLDSLLAHEIVHVVLATRYPHPHRLPSWLEEGIASRYDDADRQNTRQRIEQWFVKTGFGGVPRLANVLASDNIPADDRETYAVCASVTNLLLTRGDKQALLRFGQLAAESGPDRALAQCYGIRGVQELESLWRAWLAGAR